MQHTDEALLSVVVLERGASWPPWLAEYQKYAPDSIVVAQSADESGVEFASRIARKSDEIEHHESAIHAGLLVCNGAIDEASSVCRKKICASLLRVMLLKQRGELVLVADLRASDQARQELFTLAGMLCDGLNGTSVTVRVRFDTIRPTSAVSGVMKTATPTSLREEAQAAIERTSHGSR